MTKKKPKSQQDYILDYYKSRPREEIRHKEVVDYVTDQYEEETGEKFRDPDRAIRKVFQDGILTKLGKGIYMYDPANVQQRNLENFSEGLKAKIFKRDNYRCVICGRGPNEGYELHVDHIKPKDVGGKAVLENGQTLCSQHNMFKKNYGQTESAKKLFIRLYEQAKLLQDDKLITFTEAILETYEKHGINGHIEWKP